MSLIPVTTPGEDPLYTPTIIPPQEERIYSLDVIRGFAVFGILFISIWEFGGFAPYEQLYYQNGTHGGNFKLMNFISVLFEGKMRGLFALVFGAGILLFLNKKEFPAPISSGDAYIRRMMWLMAFGLINAFILLWPGDILFQYGVLGILLYGFSRMKAKGFFIAAIICTLIYCGKQFWNYTDDKKDFKKYTAVTKVEEKFKADSVVRARKDSLDRTKDTVLFRDTLLKNKLNDSLAKKKDTLTKKQAGEKGKWEGTVKSLKYDSAAAAAHRKLMRSKWSTVAEALLPQSKQRESVWLYSIGVWDIGAMMFLGMGLFSIGFFSGRFSSQKYLLIALITLAVGVAFACWRVHFYSLKVAGYENYIKRFSIPYNFFFPVEKLLMAVGYASLVIGLLRFRIFKWKWKALAVVGRMAFSNYILQTIVCTLFFYGYGFGYFGRLKQWELYFFVFEMALVQVAFSVLWLKYYKQGPVEWLWRCLIYQKWLPNKKV